MERSSISHIKAYGPEYIGYAQNNSSERALQIWTSIPHKPSKDCLEGWGICDFVLFPQFWGGIPIDAISMPVSSEFNGGSLNIFIAEDVSRYTKEELALEVEQDVYSQDPQSINDKSFKVPAGIYEYDESLGQYGGYTITIVKL
ncbi:MAG: hypothetical protein WCQ70_05000 [Lentimicrobiaceae bacterium]